ncbi:CASP-LIKE PROTEIN 1F2 [Salix koriyanagi]|uniref:CASP-like protein n=1 Tax=Salix koriyanagi TaxID=2511006 RepID=A0A9Q0SVQ3_9ROSI|nr:CASP-LIKE PROTEIN 1F2 [Salix koriyanagi]
MATTENTTEKGFLKAKSQQGMSTPSQPQRMFFMAQITLRILAIVFTVAAIPIMVTAKEPLSFIGLSIEPSYSQSSAMKFLLGADAIVCAFSVLSLLFVWTLSRSASPTTNYFFLILHDMVMMVLMISGCSAGTAVGYLSKYGQRESFWNPFCNYVTKFCHQMLISTVLSYLAFFCYLALNILTAYKLTPRATE